VQRVIHHERQAYKPSVEGRPEAAKQQRAEGEAVPLDSSGGSARNPPSRMRAQTEHMREILLPVAPLQLKFKYIEPACVVQSELAWVGWGGC
jgi:hypothetical protein